MMRIIFEALEKKKKLKTVRSIRILVENRETNT